MDSSCRFIEYQKTISDENPLYYYKFQFSAHAGC